MGAIKGDTRSLHSGSFIEHITDQGGFSGCVAKTMVAPLSRIAAGYDGSVSLGFRVYGLGFRVG